MKKTSVNNLEIYLESFNLANEIYKVVSGWTFFDRDTLGKQIVRSADSVTLNISEGFGRFSYQDNKQFCFYSRGSLQETKTSLQLAFSRNIIQQAIYDELIKKYEILGKRLNSYIKSINRKILQQANKLQK